MLRRGPIHLQKKQTCFLGILVNQELSVIPRYPHKILGRLWEPMFYNFSAV